MQSSTHTPSFFQNLKRGIAMVLLVGLMAPALSLSVAPPQPVHAQSITGAMVSSAVCLATYMFGAMMDGLRSFLTSGLFSVMGTYVPVHETSPTVLRSLTSIRGTSAEDARATFMLVIKECILDPIVWYLKELMITRLTEAILGSINDGFLGGPMFETNPIRFFRNVADASFNTFLFDTNVLAQLPDAFRDRVAESIYLDYYTPSYTAAGMGSESSTLDDATYALLAQGNIMETEGGILTLLEMSEDRNNPAGIYFGLSSETGTRMSRVLSQESSLLNHGDGWHSNRCDAGDADAPNWYVCTPGTWIAQQMDDWSNSSLKQLQVADEFSEIMQALLSALVSEIIGNNETGLLQSLPEEYWGGTRREFGSSDGGMDDADTIWSGINQTTSEYDASQPVPGEGGTGDDIPEGE
jgi:hypothetical protein